MNWIKSKLSVAVRWAWFGFLLLLAFSYLVSGLSEPKKTGDAAASVTTSADPIADQADNPEKPQTVESKNRRQAELRLAIDRINEVWQESLDQKSMQSAPDANWLTLCRRMSLALIGNGLSLEEIRNLEQLPEPNRPRKHLETLLRDSRFHHYWAERWTRFLVGTDNGQFVLYRRRRFRIWLANVFAENWRYNRLVSTLITAKGLWTDKPEVNFLTATFDSNNGQPDPVRLAARTSRAFLGLRIDCLQCHDDFLGNVSLGDIESPRGGLQTDFHELAAFFTGATNSFVQGVRDKKPNYKYKYLNADEEVVVEPTVPYLPELLPSNGQARNRLAAWITNPKNRQAARAAVSHVWALMFGRAAGDAVDDLPIDLETTPVLESLTDDFIEHGFDIRRLIRLIALSKPFGVDSRADFEFDEDHEDACAVFPLVRLRPEQMAGNIIQATQIKSIDRESSLITQLQKYGSTNDFVGRYGDMGEDEFTTESVTITQRLLVLNGKMMREMVRQGPMAATSHIKMFAEDEKQAVQNAYLSTLNRYPNEQELEHFVAHLENSKNRGKAIEDMFWSLLNSTELAWNH